MIDFENVSDEELLKQLRAGCEEVRDHLMEKYKGLVKKRARAMFLIGGDQDDLMQEGMIGLLKAIRDYDLEKGASFHTFADLCVNRQLYHAVEASTRQKHSPLNSYVSIDEESAGDAVKSEIASGNNELAGNPEDLIIDRENAESIRNDIFTKLSRFEKEVFLRYLDGMNYSDIAEEMDKSLKTVDNALQRIRKKAKEVIEIRRKEDGTERL